MLAFALAATVWLYVTVTQRFEGRLWVTPTRIWSAPLELEPGARLSAEELDDRLTRSGYARVDEPTHPGQFAGGGAAVRLFARGWVAADGMRVEPARFDLRFVGRRLLSVRDARGDAVGRARLEPELLATLHGAVHEEREPVALEEVPRSLVLATLAAEDARFLSHAGVDVRGIARAALANARRGRVVQGGSTITQQTVKNLYLHPRRSLVRKLREAAMSLILDARYPKERILEVYLNELYLGQRGPVAICGVAAAARFYFGREVGALGLAESATLAGMIKSPGRFNPFRHPEAALARRDEVLDAMARLEMVTPNEVDRAKAEPLTLASGSGGFAGGGYAVAYARARVHELLGEELAREGGLSVHTTIDTAWQRRAEDALRHGLDALDRSAGAADGTRLQGAVLVTRPGRGDIVAMVGGRDFGESQFNRAVQARRQPGSCFKPLVFAAGFDAAAGGGEALTAATLLRDEPLSIRVGNGEWSPRNHDGTFRGRVSVREALEQSLNVPTVHAARRVGLDRVVETARRCGIRSPLEEVPSLALGTAEVTPLELAAAYGTLAAAGIHREPRILSAVWDEAGRAVALPPQPSRQAIDPVAAGLVTEILQGVLARGTATSAARLGFRGHAAGKTGTTDDTRDAWFVGYTPELLGLTWVGYDDNRETGFSGARAALPIWVELMAHADPEREFTVAADLTTVEICTESGELAAGGCPEVREEAFAAGTQPETRCRLHEGRFKRFFRKIFGRKQTAALDEGPPEAVPTT